MPANDDAYQSSQWRASSYAGSLSNNVLIKHRRVPRGNRAAQGPAMTIALHVANTRPNMVQLTRLGANAEV
jgi:hypothetical protein